MQFLDITPCLFSWASHLVYFLEHQDFTSLFQNTKMFLKLDLICAYDQIPMADKDIMKKILWTFGLYECTKITFHIFLYFINDAFHGMDFVRFRDDVLITCRNKEGNKNSPLIRISNIYSTMNCKINSTRITFLPEIITTICIWPLIFFLKRFINILTYYKRIISHCSYILALLTDIRKWL